MSNCYHPRSPTRLGDDRRVNLPGRWRYVRLAGLIVKLPTYARLVWGIARDPRTPVGLKALLGAALAYVVTPIDIIPDTLPIFGQADDLTVLLLVLDLFIANAPAEVRAEHLSRARNGTAVLDHDLERLRSVLGDRYDQIRDRLPELLEAYGDLREPGGLKAALERWRSERAASSAGSAAPPTSAGGTQDR
jgi:uncharacterized membrane protein YkvA (DUF1232 family)